MDELLCQLIGRCGYLTSRDLSEDRFLQTIVGIARNLLTFSCGTHRMIVAIYVLYGSQCT